MEEKAYLLFCKGLKKVALEIDENGNFYISPRYYPTSEDDRKYIEELLKD
ncbi:hypothetical protein IGI67_005058 [Enterococcus sp. AZ196]